MSRYKALKPTNTRRKRQAGANSKDAQIESLASELFGVVRKTLARYGLTRSQQKRLFEGSLPVGSVPKVSAALLAQLRALECLIASWHGKVRYLDAHGKPRILNIKGRGATFDTLARQYLPNKSLADAVELACRAADARTLPGDRIALYGNMVKFSRNAANVLAQAIYHTAQVFDTGVQDVTRTLADGTGHGEALHENVPS